MNRLTVIQKIIDSIKAESYLEIGVQKGEILTNVNAKRKYGVDPEFKLNLGKPITTKTLFKDNLYNNMILYQITSDRFFDEFAPRDLTKGLDIAFVDGLHNYDQSLKDVKNCLKYLNEGGFIVMHDCNPLNYAMAYPVKQSINEALELAHKGELPGWNGSWNGDVWKALVHLRLEYDDLNIFTLDLDWGLGIISKSKSLKIDDVTIEQLQQSDYYFLEKNRDKLLNLKHPKYLDQFLAEYNKTLNTK